MKSKLVKSFPLTVNLQEVKATEDVGCNGEDHAGQRTGARCWVVLMQGLVSLEAGVLPQEGLPARRSPGCPGRASCFLHV